MLLCALVFFARCFGSMTRSNVWPPEVQDDSNAFWRHGFLRVTDPRAA
jgi:hypothetical protein